MTKLDLSDSTYQDQSTTVDLYLNNAINCTDISTLLYAFCSTGLSLNNQLIPFLSNIEIPAGIKDLNSKHIFCNKAFLHLGGIPDKYSYLGKSDGELPTLFSSFESEFIIQDKRVIETGQHIKVLDIHPYGKGKELKPMIFHKIPCFNEYQKCIGTIYFAENVSYYMGMSQQIRNLLLNYKNSASSFFIGKPTDIIRDYEWEVVFMIANNMQLKEVALFLNKAYSTVNGYKNDSISKLNHLGVFNHKQLIQFVYDNGWQQHVPPRFLMPKSIILPLC